jgi:hypothetical protein
MVVTDAGRLDHLGAPRDLHELPGGDLLGPRLRQYKTSPVQDFANTRVRSVFERY